MAISLFANIVIGGIFYNLFDGMNVGTLAGTLTASLVGAVLGVVAISTAMYKPSAIITRGATAGAFIGMVGGLLGSISTEEISGIGTNVYLVCLVVGAIVGAAGMRGAGMKFFYAWVDEKDEDLGAIGKLLDGILVGVINGAALGAIAALYHSSIFISPTYIPGAIASPIEHTVRVITLDELLIGGILGIGIGAITGLVLPKKRMIGFLSFTLAGVWVGVVLALPYIITTTFTEFSAVAGGMTNIGKIALVALGGAILGLTTPTTPNLNFITSSYRSALIGAGVGTAVVLPSVMYATLLAIDGNNPISNSLWDNFLIWNRGNGSFLITSAVCGAAICLIMALLINRMHNTAIANYAMLISAFSAAIGVQGSGFLFVLGWDVELFRNLFFKDSFASILLRLLLNVSLGVLMGIVIRAILIFATSRSTPALMPQTD